MNAPSRRSTLISLVPVALVAASIAGFAAVASAQARLDQLSGRNPRPTPSFTSDGGTDARIASNNVGSGNGPTVSSGPSSALSGSADSHPEAITGPINEADAARILRSRMSQLQPCFDQARTRDRRFTAARVNVRLTIERDGRVRPPLLNVNPANPEMLSCLNTAIVAMTFPRPATSPLVLSYPMNFVPAPTAAPVRPRGTRR
ncbi:MAG: AgmX/PglI C-terminal domain-containing protein [Deltaproteobacteria bacterium]|nr:AgmX/PglI C-terminal domain-containing protein [Deltaproteobacteria bacterium]